MPAPKSLPEVDMDDMQFLITRLNGVAGDLSNHADGVREISSERAQELYDRITEVVDRLRDIHDREIPAKPRIG